MNLAERSVNGFEIDLACQLNNAGLCLRYAIIFNLQLDVLSLLDN